MAPGMGADSVALALDLLDHFWVGDGLRPYHKEGGLGAFAFKGVNNSLGMVSQRAVVEGQNDFAIGQEIKFFVLLLAKPRARVVSISTIAGHPSARDGLQTPAGCGQRGVGCRHQNGRGKHSARPATRAAAETRDGARIGLR